LLTLLTVGDSIAASTLFKQVRMMVRKSSSSKSGKTKAARPIFDSIRKPVAPPGHPLSHSKPDEIARPAQRKAKHKRRPELPSDEDA
jgi:hypothetical protein